MENLIDKSRLPDDSEAMASQSLIGEAINVLYRLSDRCASATGRDRIDNFVGEVLMKMDDELQKHIDGFGA